MKILPPIGILVLFVKLSPGLASTITDHKSLRMVLVLFRHGLRSPVGSFPTDPHANYSWVGGYGALQPKGAEQLYQLGRNLRQRYQFLIPRNSNKLKRSIYAVSSSKKRCILSLENFLAGFLNSTDVSKHLHQAVPVSAPTQMHIITPEQDTIFLVSRSCPNADIVETLLKKDRNSSLAQFHHDGTKLQHYISSLIGAPISSLLQLGTVCDVLYLYPQFGLFLPDWSAKVHPSKCRSLIQKYLLSFTASPELKRLRGGAILTEYLRRMESVRKNSKRRGRRIFLYSGHDVTQTMLFDSMGLKKQAQRRPNCGSAVVFELHENDHLGDDLEVRLSYYQRPKRSVPKKLRIPNCPAPCSLTMFEESVRHILIDDYDSACTESTSQMSFTKKSVF